MHGSYILNCLLYDYSHYYAETGFSDTGSPIKADHSPSDIGHNSSPSDTGYSPNDIGSPKDRSPSTSLKDQEYKQLVEKFHSAVLTGNLRSVYYSSILLTHISLAGQDNNYYCQCVLLKK